MILSTHIMQEVNAVCDRVLILRAGRIAVDERLDALQKTSGLAVHTAPQIDVAALLQPLSEVTGVAANGAGRWQVTLSDTESGCNAVARALVAADAPIYALTPQVRDLETIFTQISAGADAEVSHAA